MIPSQYVNVTISNNGKYYEKMGFADVKQGSIISVDISLLPKNSNKVVMVVCDCCAVEFSRSLQLLNRQDAHRCVKCHYLNNSEKFKGNKWGFTKDTVGEKHPRWKPNNDEFRRYVAKVHYVSHKQDLSSLENSDKPRGRNGVAGAYQLDHIVPVSKAYEMGWTIEEASNINNLRFIPWEENLEKSNKY